MKTSSGGAGNAREPVGLADVVRIYHRLDNARTESDVLVTLSEEFRRVIGTKVVLLGVLLDNPLRARMLRGADVGSNIVFEKLPDIPVQGDAMMEEIIQADHVVVVEDSRTDPRTHKPTVELVRSRTLINVPMFRANGRLGAISTGTFNDKPVLRITQDQIRYFEAVGSYVAMALDRQLFNANRPEDEAALFRANELLQATLKLVGDGVVITDVQGHIEYVNPAAAAFAVMPAGQWEGRSMHEVFALLDEHTLQPLASLSVGGVDGDADTDANASHGESPALPQLRLLAAKDAQGMVHLLQWGTVTIFDAAGAPQGMVLLLSDIGEPPPRPVDGVPDPFEPSGTDARRASPHATVVQLRQRMNQALAIDQQAAGSQAREEAAPLTARERECLAWCAAGKTAWETGQILGISQWTVVYHLDRLKRRFGLVRKQQLVARAIDLGLVAGTERDDGPH